MGAELAEKNLFPQNKFTELIQHPPQNILEAFPFLAGKPGNVGLEGYLFPDTYRFFPDATAEEVVKKMLENFGNKFTPEIQADVQKSGHSLFEIITMASLIEKEVPTDQDRAIVSGILWKRLEK